MPGLYEQAKPEQLSFGGSPHVGDAAGTGSTVLSDLLLTKPDQGETESNQDELSPQKSEDSD